MKITPWMVCVLCIMLLTACGPDEKELAEAWTICGASAGSPTGKPVTGTVYEVDSINSGAPGVTLDGYDNPYLRLSYRNFTTHLSESSAVLCTEIKTSMMGYCNYPSDANVRFTLRGHRSEAHVRLFAWPSKELIAETTLQGQFGSENNLHSDFHCPSTVLHEQGEKSQDVYQLLDLSPWLEQYVTAKD